MKNKSKNKEPENLLLLQSLFLPMMWLSRRTATSVSMALCWPSGPKQTQRFLTVKVVVILLFDLTWTCGPHLMMMMHVGSGSADIHCTITSVTQ